MTDIESVLSNYRLSFEKLAPDFKYGIVGKFTHVALKFFGFDGSETQRGMSYFKFILKKKYREKCKSLHPDTADQKLITHPHYKAVGFRRTVRLYKRLENIKCLPISLDKIDIYVELDRFQNPDMGFDINTWISRRRVVSWG